MLPDLPVSQYPAWALCNVMELVRLAAPRRRDTQSHFFFAAEVVAEVKADAGRVRGVRIVKQAPFLRHFTCECEWT